MHYRRIEEHDITFVQWQLHTMCIEIVLELGAAVRTVAGSETL